MESSAAIAEVERELERRAFLYESPADYLAGVRLAFAKVRERAGDEPREDRVAARAARRRTAGRRVGQGV